MTTVLGSYGEGSRINSAVEATKAAYNANRPKIQRVVELTQGAAFKVLFWGTCFGLSAMISFKLFFIGVIARVISTHTMPQILRNIQNFIESNWYAKGLVLAGCFVARPIVIPAAIIAAGGFTAEWASNALPRMERVESGFDMFNADLGIPVSTSNGSMS